MPKGYSEDAKSKDRLYKDQIRQTIIYKNTTHKTGATRTLQHNWW